MSGLIATAVNLLLGMSSIAVTTNPSAPFHVHQASMPGCRYDAVTTEGILQWQDTLNHLNMPFFEAADAIFINYTWKEETPSQAAAVAGARKYDVYMGVDVFGRNTYGGGGMSCNVALTAARSAGWQSPPMLCIPFTGGPIFKLCALERRQHPP